MSAPSSIEDLDELMGWNELQSRPFEYACEHCGHDDHMQWDQDAHGLPVCIRCSAVSTLPYLDRKPKCKRSHADEDPKDDCVDFFVDTFLPKSSMTVVMSAGGSIDFQMLRKLQNSFMPSEERALWGIQEYIKGQVEDRGIPGRCISEAMFLFKKLQDKGREFKDCTRGFIRKAVIACCLHHVCQESNIWKTPKEWCEWFDLTPEQWSKGMSRFQELVQHRQVNVHVVSATSSDYMLRFASQLQATPTQTQELILWCDRIREHQISSSNTPLSIVGSVLQLFAERHALPWTKTQIATTCGISVATIQKVSKELAKYPFLFDSLLGTTRPAPEHSSAPRKKKAKTHALVSNLPSL
jgi:transcription initiation factor TFIIIB Brf1 subunit/transcription initiation factor TFIIB